MTCLQDNDDRFASWHYRRDPTHVVFYRAETLQRLAQQRGWTCGIPAKDVALLSARQDLRRQNRIIPKVLLTQIFRTVRQAAILEDRGMRPCLR